MLVGEQYVKNMNDVNNNVNEFIRIYGYRPDYIALSLKTLSIVCSSIKVNKTPKQIEYSDYVICNELHPGFIVLAEY